MQTSRVTRYLARRCLPGGRLSLLRHKSAMAQAVATSWDEARPFEEIPGPKALPVVGTLLRKRAPDAVQDYRNLKAEYGPILKEKIGPMRILYISDPDDIRTMLQYEGKYPYRGKVMDLEGLYCKHSGHVKSLGSMDGEEWHEGRGTVHKYFMRSDAVRPFLSTQEDLAEELVEWLRFIRDENYEVANLKEEMFKFALESVFNICFDIRLKNLDTSIPLDAEERKLAIQISKMMVGLDTGILSPLKLYRYFPTPMWYNYKNPADYVRSVFKGYWEQTVQKMEAVKRGEEGAEMPRLVYHMTREKDVPVEMIESVLFSLVQGGVDSSGNGLTWLLYNLATNPDKQAKLHEEIDRELPLGKRLESSSFESLPYLRACYQESHRFHYPVRSGPTRILPQDTVIRGYRIPKSTLVVPLNPASCLSDEYFTDPEKFIPERWIRGIDRKRGFHPFLVLPFGHGPRSCLGRRFADQEIRVAIAKLMQVFRFEYHHQPVNRKASVFVTQDKVVRMRVLDR